MRRGKRGAVDAAKALDQADQASEWPSGKITVLERREREPGAFNREKDRNDVAHYVRRHAGRHHRPESAPLTPAFERDAYNGEVNEVADVRQLYHIVQYGLRELPEP